MFFSSASLFLPDTIFMEVSVCLGFFYISYITPKRKGEFVLVLLGFVYQGVKKNLGIVTEMLQYYSPYI